MNAEMFHSKEDAEGTIGDSGTLDVNETRILDGFGRMTFNENSIANSLAFINVINASFRITMDTQEEMAIFVPSPFDSVTQKFIVSNSGSFHHNLWDDASCFYDKI